LEQSYEKDVMYCIISLPRTSSTSAWHLLYASMMMVHPESARHPLSSKFSAFNPRYLSPDEIEQKFQKIVSSDVLPVIKIVSNHDFTMVDRILQTRYKTVFIEPVSLKKQVLKVLVAKKTDTFVSKENRKKNIATVKITESDILERFQYYQKHMEYQYRCDYYITDSMIQQHPEDVQRLLHLPVMKSKHQYSTFEITDDMMLDDVDAFNTLYDNVSLKTFGEIL